MRHFEIAFQSMFEMLDSDCANIRGPPALRTLGERARASKLSALFDDQLPEPALCGVVFELFVPNLADTAFG